MGRKKDGTIIITCPGCKKKCIEKFSDIVEVEESFCPYCGRSFGAKGDLIGEIQKELEK